MRLESPIVATVNRSAARLRCAACGSIDIHTHVVPADFPDYVGGTDGSLWPRMEPAGPCHRRVMIQGRVFRTVSHQSWDRSIREADMQRLGVAHQVLSPMPELLSYWLPLDDAAAMCRHLNDFIASLVSSAPASFSGLGVVPLQDVDAAIRELEHVVSVLGLSGVEIGTNINGRPIGHPDFLEFFKAAEAFGAAVFVHALKPAGMERLVGPAALEHALAYPTDVGLAAASMITGGNLASCPGLRIAFSHGAGTLAQMLPRLQHAWSVLPELQTPAFAPSPRELARRMFVDDLVYDDVAIRFLAEVFGASQILLGSDYPFVIQDPDPVGRVAASGMPEAARQAILRVNALRWLDGDGPIDHDEEASP